jgi:hypothetical protein
MITKSKEPFTKRTKNTPELPSKNSGVFRYN